jgi:6-hydroxy-3-succinoylpyridine 3-monooxygenase
VAELHCLIDRVIGFVLKCLQPPGSQSDKNGEAAGRKSRRKAVFAHVGRRKPTRMQQGSEEQNALRTRVYIDGYNLYYGCLKRSYHKWLDPRALVECILPTILYEKNGEPIRYRFQTPAIKYFTAPILEAFAKSDDSTVCQSHYHASLEGHLQGEFRIVKGYHDARPARAHRWEEGKAARECDKVDVWKLEEKQSDVALALHAYSDAIRKEVDQVIVLTNDTDFVPSIRMIREHTPVIVGLIAPLKEGRGAVNAEIEKHAHWTRKHIRDEEFAHSQLPHMIRCKGGVIHKPITWYPRPDLLTPIYEEAKRVKRSAGAARKWLNQPCAHLGARVPIEMCSEDGSAQELKAYMESYAREFGV